MLLREHPEKNLAKYQYERFTDIGAHPMPAHPAVTPRNVAGLDLDDA